MAIYQFNYPTKILSGPGARRRLPAALQAQGLSRPLIVTDRGIAPLAITKDLAEILRKEGLEISIFSGIWGNPVKSQVEEGVRAYRAAHADSIIAFGGGAALDVAKVIGLLVNHPGDLFDYEDGRPDARPVDQPLPWLVTLPTTAGTGSEVGRSSVVSEDDTHRKRIIFDPRMMPPLSILDAELTLELPAPITAATGMDALTHLVEAFLAKGHHPLADGIALEGVRIIAKNLLPVVSLARCIDAKEPLTAEEDAFYIQGRQALLEAASMGAVAFQKGLGVTHSCAHALSTVCDLHHGLANAILMPYCMAFNLSVSSERFSRLAVAAGLKTDTPESFLAWLKELNRDLQIPATLADVGVRPDQIETLVSWAVQDGCHPSNPRPVTRQDFIEIFQKAIAG